MEDMLTHHGNVGEIVEKVVRRSGISVTELAHRMHVNRRSVYNWFSQKYLSFKIVHQVGCVLGHDFSIEFPDQFAIEPEKGVLLEDIEHPEYETAYYWKDKYINLLEKYNQQLEKQAVMAMHN